MAKIYYSLLLLLIFHKFGIAQPFNAVFHYAAFNIPSEKPFLETYIAVFGNTVNYARSPDDKLKARIEITMTFSDGDSIAAFRKYILENTMDDDSNKTPVNFIDIQRITMNQGIYTLNLLLKDLNAKEKTELTHSEIIAVDFPDSIPNFSGIEPAEQIKQAEKESKLAKSGVEITPYVSSFYPENMEKISFYTELYGMEKAVGAANDFLLVYYLEENLTRIRKTGASKFKKMKADKAISIIGELNIKNLPSGNYNLVIEARDRENKVLATRKTLMQRSNPKIETIEEFTLLAGNGANFFEEITNIDSLRFHIASLYPISGIKERQYANNMLSGKDVKVMQNYLFQFWNARDPENPKKAWKVYLEQVYLVNKLFATGAGFKYYGFESDRGRIFLQYGAPNSVISRKFETASYPYEIWHYYKAEKQSDIRFVFYNPKIVGEDYVLLHSNAIGEINNPAWKIALSNKADPTDYDATEEIKLHGDHKDDDWGNTKNRKK